MATIDFRASVADPGTEEHRLYNSLADYAQPESELLKADVVDIALKSYDPPNDNVTLVMVIHSIAEQIPYDHPSHPKFAELIVAIDGSDERLQMALAHVGHRSL